MERAAAAYPSKSSGGTPSARAFARSITPVLRKGDMARPAARISRGRGKGRTLTPLAVALATSADCSAAMLRAT
jgi:hypothetical protein